MHSICCASSLLERVLRTPKENAVVLLALVAGSGLCCSIVMGNTALRELRMSRWKLDKARTGANAGIIACFPLGTHSIQATSHTHAKVTGKLTEGGRACFTLVREG